MNDNLCGNDRNVGAITYKYHKIIAWGVGNYFEQYQSLLAGKIAYAVDKNTDLHGKKKAGITVYPLTKLEKEQNKESCLIVAFCARFEDILEDASNLGAFDIVDVRMLEILNRCSCNLEINLEKYEVEEVPILICAGIHALWEVNGARKFIDAQSQVLHKKGIHTLELAPLKYYQRCDKSRVFVVVSLDKKIMNVIPLSVFVNRYSVVSGLIIHSLYYDHEILQILLRQVSVRNKILYYAHDYYCICNYRFLYYRDKSCIKDEGLNCLECENRKQQERIYRFHRNLFDKYSIQLIAPSRYTASLLEQVFEGSVPVVLPHLTYKEIDFYKPIKPVKRIAYVGMVNWSKGWKEYLTIYEHMQGQYEFYCLGGGNADNYVEGIRYISVSMEKDGEKIDMVEALKNYCIDIVYLGSKVPETFSYTYYEAFEAGCFVITNECSGNICSQVRTNGNGIVLKTIEETIQWLDNSEKVTDVVGKMNRKITNVQADESFLKYLF